MSSEGAGGTDEREDVAAHGGGDVDGIDLRAQREEFFARSSAVG